jgi:hypothetical protein
MASHCVPCFPELEVRKARPTAADKESARTDLGDGARPSDVGPQERIAGELKLKLGIRVSRGLSASTGVESVRAEEEPISAGPRSFATKRKRLLLATSLCRSR